MFLIFVLIVAVIYYYGIYIPNARTDEVTKRSIEILEEHSK
jgi:hypothetical protein